MTLFETLKKELKPQQVKMDKCICCGQLTDEMNMIADDVDEDGQPTGYRDFCHNTCYEYMQEI